MPELTDDMNAISECTDPTKMLSATSNKTGIWHGYNSEKVTCLHCEIERLNKEVTRLKDAIALPPKSINKYDTMLSKL